MQCYRKLDMFMQFDMLVLAHVITKQDQVGVSGGKAVTSASSQGTIGLAQHAT